MRNIVMYLNVNALSHEMQLSEEEFDMFLPVCRTINLPIQPPISVSFSKKVCITEEPTGRVIEYRSITPESAININYRDCTFVSFNSQFGYIDRLFMYRGIDFAFITKFDCVVNISNGLVSIADITMNSQTIC